MNLIKNAAGRVGLLSAIILQPITSKQKHRNLTLGTTCKTNQRRRLPMHRNTLHTSDVASFGRSIGRILVANRLIRDTSSWHTESRYNLCTLIEEFSGKGECKLMLRVFR